MPYRVQVTADFRYRIGYRVNPDDDVRFVAAGIGTSLADAQTKAQTAITADRTNRAAFEDKRTILFDSTFPD